MMRNPLSGNPLNLVGRIAISLKFTALRFSQFVMAGLDPGDSAIFNPSSTFVTIDLRLQWQDID
jgi:hypothetical protein